MEEERPFHFVCGKCRGRGLYKDVDGAIACLLCGNRFYGDQFVKIKGEAPVKIYHDPEPIKISSGHFQTQRMENIAQGSSLPKFWRNRKKEETMSKKGACRNCSRVLSIIGNQCCFTCYNAAKGLSGDDKAAALSAIKKKIDSGELRKTGPGHKPLDNASIPGHQGEAVLTRQEANRWRAGNGSLSIERHKGTAEQYPAEKEIPFKIRIMIEINVRVNGAVQSA